MGLNLFKIVYSGTIKNSGAIFYYDIDHDEWIRVRRIHYLNTSWKKANKMAYYDEQSHEQKRVRI